jgi:hypothetical protein
LAKVKPYLPLASLTGEICATELNDNRATKTIEDYILIMIFIVEIFNESNQF